MSSIGGRTADFSTGNQARRLACNRCRNQKLRCERAEGVNGDEEACRRCRKANIACHISPPRRMGRPKRTHQSNMSFYGAETGTFQVDLQSGNIQHPPQCTFQLQNTPIAIDQLKLPANAPGLFSDGTFDLEFALEKPAGDDLFTFPPHLQHQQYAAVHDANSDRATADLREDYIEKLSTLSSSLLKQLRRMNKDESSPKATNSFTPTSSAESTHSCTVALFGRCPENQLYPVGEILRSTQKFLVILKHFVLSSAKRDAAGPNSPSQYESPASKMEYDSASMQTVSTQPHSQPLNLPTAMAIFTCYISLVRVHRRVFTQIHSAILAAAASTSPQDLPAFLSDVQLDGFDLSNYSSLQITILIRVSLELLGRIERAVTALAGGRNNGDPVAAKWMDISDEYAPLFKLVVQQDAEGEADEYFNADTTKYGGVASLTILAGKIQQSLNDNTCLQLQEADLLL